MGRPTDPLREDHDHLGPHIQHLEATAGALQELSFDEIRRALREAHAFLTGHVLPHAETEEAVIYPAVARALHSPQATATMIRDHAEIEKLTSELEALRERLDEPMTDAHQGRALRVAITRVLYSLHAILALHIAKEEELYLPLLDRRLTPTEAAVLIAKVREAAGESGRLVA